MIMSLVNRSNGDRLEICWTVLPRLQETFTFLSSNSHCCHANLQTIDKLSPSKRHVPRNVCEKPTSCNMAAEWFIASNCITISTIWQSQVCIVPLTLSFHQISILYRESIRLDLHISKTRDQTNIELTVFIGKKVYIFFLVLLSCTRL
jgi:hypothetical protein